MRIYRIKAEDERDFYYKVLLVLTNMIDIRPAAVKVLGEFIYWNNKYRELSDDARAEMVMSYETKAEIIERLGITQAYLHNQLHYLRQKGIIENGRLSKEYDKISEDYGEILFTIEKNG